MKLKLLFFLISLSTGLFAQDAYHTNLLTKLQNDYGLSGGNWVLTPNENTNATNANHYGHTVTQSTITGQDFTKAIRLNVNGVGANPWDAGYSIPNVNAIQTGDKVLMVIWLKTISSAGAAGQLAIFAENKTTYHKEVLLNANPTSEWKQYLIPFESSDNYPVGDLNIGFHLAYQQQVLEYGGLALINYGNTVTLASLPQQLNLGGYAGDEPNAPWRTAAANRIEQHRKANLQLQVKDRQGNALANTTVRVEMLRHHYAFGTAVNPRRLANNSQFNSTYQNKLLNLDGNGHGFNWVVTENALKWDAWENNWAGTPTETVNGIQWLTDNQIKVRGHVLVWPGFNFMPSDMQNNSTDPAYLKNRINGRLNTMLNYPGIKNKVKEWDVINEIVHVRDIENALKGTTGYITGREIYPEIFNKTAQEAPNLVKYINDYNVLNNGSVVGGDYLLYKSMIQEILTAGAAIDGIGFQAHMESSLIAPDSLYAILEDCYQTFGKTIKITEYDQSSIIPDTTAAKYTGDFLTMIFSHPATNGFLMWGFWDGAHWNNNAPLFNQNWTPKPTLTTFNDLLFNQWWTDTTLTTDANGTINIRGFKGDYKITATINSTDVEANLELYDDLNTSIQLFGVSSKTLLKETDIKLSPNPAKDYLRLELPNADDWTIYITDNLGRVVFEKSSREVVYSLEVGNYPKGVYYLTIKNKVGATVSKKLVLMH